MPSPRRLGSPSIRQTGDGCTTARADQEPPSTPGIVETSCGTAVESAQNRHAVSERGAGSGTSSPVITQERVIGSFRSSMRVGNHCSRLHVNCRFHVTENGPFRLL